MPNQRRRLVFLLLAILIAIGVIVAARGILVSDDDASAPAVADAPAQPEKPAAEVLVAKKDLPAGSFVAAEDVEFKAWPPESTTDAMIKKGAEEKTYVGAVVRTGLRAGEPIVVGRILKSDQHGFLAAVLSPGMRAMTVKITPVSGVAGFIFPNDLVDVILAHEVQRPEDTRTVDRRVSETVLDNVRVVALDQKTDDQNNEPKTAELATLEVTPKQAEKLALVSQMGSLSLVLRSLATNVVPVDNTKPAIAKDDSSGLAPQLLEAAARAMPASTARPLPAKDITWDSDVSSALPAPQAKATTVQIYRGSNMTDVSFGSRQQ